jgi:hypothetical protein
MLVQETPFQSTTIKTQKLPHNNNTSTLETKKTPVKRKKIELGLVLMDTDTVYKFQMIFLMSSFNLNGFHLNLLLSRILKVEITGILK